MAAADNRLLHSAASSDISIGSSARRCATSPVVGRRSAESTSAAVRACA